jgi:hypothetical protein
VFNRHCGCSVVQVRTRVVAQAAAIGSNSWAMRLLVRHQWPGEGLKGLRLNVPVSCEAISVSVWYMNLPVSLGTNASV